MTQSADIAVFDDANLPALVLTSRVSADDMVRRVREAVDAEPVDLSTAAGRKRIASLAYKVAQTKTGIEKAAKALTADFRRQTDAVNAERNRIVGELQVIQDEARRPLTEWEEAEEARGKSILSRLDELDAGRIDARSPIQLIRSALEWLDGVDLTTGWDEYADRAQRQADECRRAWTAALAAAEKAEADRIELERLRAEAAERAEREARELEERRRSEERARQEREAQEAAARAERERHEREVADARAAVERADREKVEAEARAKREAEAAIKAAEMRAAEIKAAEERAAETERRRIADARAAEIAAEERRRANAERRATMLAQIVEDIADKTRSQIAEAILDGRVRHVRAVF